MRWLSAWIGHAASPLAPSGRALRRGRPELGRCQPLHDGWRGPGGRLRGRDGEHFGVGLAVVLGQDLAEIAGPVRDGAVADLAACDRQMGNGHREAAGAGTWSVHHFHDASPAGVILSCAGRHAADGCQPRADCSPAPVTNRPSGLQLDRSERGMSARRVQRTRMGVGDQAVGVQHGRLASTPRAHSRDGRSGFVLLPDLNGSWCLGRS